MWPALLGGTWVIRFNYWRRKKKRKMMVLLSKPPDRSRKKGKGKKGITIQHSMYIQTKKKKNERCCPPFSPRHTSGRQCLQCDFPAVVVFEFLLVRATGYTIWRVDCNQDIILCVKIGRYMLFLVHRGFRLPDTRYLVYIFN